MQNLIIKVSVVFFLLTGLSIAANTSTMNDATPPKSMTATQAKQNQQTAVNGAKTDADEEATPDMATGDDI